MFVAAILLSVCTVTAVHDGDTLTATCAKRAKPIVVRVAEIDAPELKAFTWPDQPGGKDAAAEAKSMCLGRPARLHLSKYDQRTSRWIAHVDCDGIDLSAHMVSAGLAWSYLPDKRSKIPALQATAQAGHLGIWGMTPPAIEPLKWRQGAWK